MSYRAYLRGIEFRLEAALDGRLTGGDVLVALRAFVHDERGRILQVHRAGAPGRENVTTLSGLTDAVVRALFRQAVVAAGLPSVGVAPCALVALGGYGRRELHPASDVDLMLLFRERDDAYLRSLTEHLFHALVDLRFELGYAYRSIPDCLGLADADHRSLASLLEARFVAGQRSIFAQFQTALRRFLSPARVHSFVERKLNEQARRHGAYGAPGGEPNVKETPGGLRDLHTARWIAQVKVGMSGFGGLRSAGLLSEKETARCLVAFEFLLRVRSELHYLSGKHDILSASLQPQVADNLGFHHVLRGDEGGTFMGRYSQCAKEVRSLSSAIVARARAHRLSADMV
jgi:[protein-PII] uridylyltransferase